MYKEIEDVLREAMQIKTEPNDDSDSEIVDEQYNLRPDPLQGIEEGLEFVNNILTNTLEKRDENSCDISKKSDLAQYLQSKSFSILPGMQSLVDFSPNIQHENLFEQLEEASHKKPSPGIKARESAHDELQRFLVNKDKSYTEDSNSQLMSSPIMKPSRVDPKYVDPSALKEKDFGPDIFTPEKPSLNPGDEKENTEMFIMNQSPNQPSENTSKSPQKSSKVIKSQIYIYHIDIIHPNRTTS